jgi:hypothetical protein
MLRSELVAALGCGEGFALWLEEAELVAVEGDVYEARAIERARVCWNLHEMGVNEAGLEVILGLLDRLHDERREHLRTVQYLRRRAASSGR